MPTRFGRSKLSHRRHINSSRFAKTARTARARSAAPREVLACRQSENKQTKRRHSYNAPRKTDKNSVSSTSRSCCTRLALPRH